MAVTIFSGSIGPGQAGAAVAVPEASKYTVISSGGLLVQVSNDGVNFSAPTYTVISNSNPNMSGLGWPVAYMRVVSTNSETFEAYASVTSA